MGAGGTVGAATADGERWRSDPLAARWETAWSAAPTWRRSWFGAALVTSILLGAWVRSVGSVGPVTGVAIAGVGVVAAAAAVVDAHEHRLPNELTAAAVLLALAGAVGGPPSQVGPALLGGFVAGAAMSAVHLSRGVGLGDVKLAAGLGLSAGSMAAAAAPVAIAIAATLAASTGAITGRRRLPLGPSLWAGWAIAVGAAAGGWFSGVMS